MAEVPQPKTTISLQPSDGDVVEVSPAIAKQMQVVQLIIEDDSFDPSTDIIPLPEVTTFQLTKIVDYLTYHRNGKAVADDGNDSAKFDEEFLKELSEDQLKKLLHAANFLNVKEVLDFLCQAVANMIQNKSVNYVRKFFGVENDYTPEEENELRQTYAWAFEGINED